MNKILLLLKFKEITWVSSPLHKLLSTYQARYTYKFEVLMRKGTDPQCKNCRDCMGYLFLTFIYKCAKALKNARNVNSSRNNTDPQHTHRIICKGYILFIHKYTKALKDAKPKFESLWNKCWLLTNCTQTPNHELDASSCSFRNNVNILPID